MSARQVILNGFLQGDLDFNGFRPLNIDLTDIISDQFGLQAANTVFAGPTHAGDANPTFRALVLADIPAGVMLTSQNLAGLANLATSRTNLGLTAPATAASTATGLLLLNIVPPSLEGTNFLQSVDNVPQWATPASVLSSIGAEAALGNPGTNGFVLSSTTGGVRSWISQTAVVLPVVDSTAVVKGSADATKLLRFEVDGFTTGVTRVLTPPNYDGVIATLAGGEDLTNKSYNGILLETAGGEPLLKIDTNFSASGGEISLVGKVGGSILDLPASGTLATVADTEPDLGNPASNGYVLSSTAAGTRSWIDFIFPESKPVVKGSSDPSKLLRFEVEGFTSGVTRTLSAPDYDGTIATRAGIETLSNKTLAAVAALGIKNGVSGFDLQVANNDVSASATRILSISLANANRNIVLGGNFSIAHDFQSAGTGDIILRAPADADVTLPETGTLTPTVGVPGSAGADGITGQIAFNATHLYACVATDTWVRCALATWP